MFKIALMLSIVFGPNLTVHTPVLIPIEFPDIGSCNAVRTAKTFTDVNAKLVAETRKKYRGAKVSLDSTCYNFIAIEALYVNTY